jgi:hypothetical protein
MKHNTALLLKARTSQTRAEAICNAIRAVYSTAQLFWMMGKYEVRFHAPAGDTKHVWLLLIFRDAKSMRSLKKPTKRPR